jgi:ElaA protein
MTNMPKIAMEWQRFDELSSDELYEMLRFRQSIFVVEQRSPYPDLDGLDQKACHLVARMKDTLAGYLRLSSAPLRIGRVAVAASLRGCGLGRRLMREALSRCRVRHGGVTVALTAQAHLLRFYREFGFEPTGEPFDDHGVAHIDMELRT